ncbi:MAG: hypothetical protein KF850_02945 [Labilithrix sp.]|nr:hypothetical protein [Labilithrix sp.]
MSMRRGYVIAASVFVLFACGKTVATLGYEHVGTVKETPLALPPGAKVRLAVRAESYSYFGRNHVMLDAELLKDGAVVAKMSCQGFEFEGGSGSGCKSTHYNSGCSITAPPGGADALRVGTRMENGNGASIEGLSVLVKQ